MEKGKGKKSLTAAELRKKLKERERLDRLNVARQETRERIAQEKKLSEERQRKLASDGVVGVAVIKAKNVYEDAKDQLDAVLGQTIQPQQVRTQPVVAPTAPSNPAPVTQQRVTPQRAQRVTSVVKTNWQLFKEGFLG